MEVCEFGVFFEDCQAVVERGLEVVVSEMRDGSVDKRFGEIGIDFESLSEVLNRLVVLLEVEKNGASM